MQAQESLPEPHKDEGRRPSPSGPPGAPGTCLDVADEVRAAVREGRPVVALESTVLAHGLPWPDNLEVALAAEAVIRAAGAVPATVAVIGGRLRVGVEREALERIARG